MSNSHYDICIIGAGPAGLAAAIESSRRGLSCLLLDRNKKPGRKLYATGNGRCNLCNDNYDRDCYYGSDFAAEIIYKRNLRDFVVEYMDNLGIKTVSKNGYYYPMSMQASTVVWALRDAAVMNGTEILTDSEVTSVEDKGDKYIISYSGGKTVEAKSVIVATGGPSAPDLGAAPFQTLYSLYRSLNLNCEMLRPCLCPVEVREDLSSIAGVRCDAEISLHIAEQRERGELQITAAGLSGIVSFNMNEYMQKQSENGYDIIHVNLLPDVTYEEFIYRFNTFKKNSPNRKILGFLNGFLNDKLALYQLNLLKEAGSVKDDVNVSEIEAGLIYRALIDWKLQIKQYNDLTRSQASAGGIETSQIDPKDMHIINRRELYAVGEATDVLGKCGGYNISYALYTGYLAGRACLGGSL